MMCVNPFYQFGYSYGNILHIIRNLVLRSADIFRAIGSIVKFRMNFSMKNTTVKNTGIH